VTVPRTAIGLAAAIAAASGCGHLAAGEDVPALLVAPTPAVRAELRAALTDALGIAPRAIAEDALTRTSVLVIERAVAEAANRPLTGRTVDTGAVQRFQLVVNDGRCILVRPADGWRAALPAAACTPE